MTRAEVQKELQHITQSVKDHRAVKDLMIDWLAAKQVSAFDTQQILNDLTSYPEYLELVN